MQQILERVAQTPAGWNELLDGVSHGDAELCTSLQERLRPGIRLLLGHKPLRENEDTVTAEVLTAVVRLIRSGEIRDTATLVRSIRTEISKRVAPRRAAAREGWADNPSRALDLHLSAREREMMRRFYVGAEHPLEICRAMGVTMEEFTRVKSLARAAVAVSLAATRHDREACA